MQGKHTCFHPKTKQHRKNSDQKNAFMSRCKYRVQCSARCKGQRTAIPVKEKNSEQSEVRAAHRIEQVLQRRHNRLSGAIVQNQRHGSQRHQFIKQIHGHKITGKSQCNQYSVYNKIKTKKPAFSAFMLHINKRINADCSPYHADHSNKYSSNPIYMKKDRNILHQIKQRQTEITGPRKHNRKYS